MSAAMRRCYDLLSRTGRAYGLCLRHLEPEIRHAQCLIYLVMRSVDAVEDDLAIPNDVKVTMLTSFDKYLRDPTWKYTTGTDEYACVLENFPSITEALGETPDQYRDIILEMGSQIGRRTASFVGKPMNTMEDLNQYCQQVSATFVSGVARLFVAAGMEEEIKDMSLLLDLAVCLQATNFIRDFWKDWNYGVLLYPTEVWSKYVKHPDDLLKTDNFEAGVRCVNQLVTHVLQHVPLALSFIHSLWSLGARQTFGIYEMLSIATLERCYNSSRPFTEVVKVGRDQMEEILQSASSLEGILNNVRLYTDRILASAHQTKHPTPGTVDACRQILSQIDLLQSSQQ